MRVNELETFLHVLERPQRLLKAPKCQKLALHDFRLFAEVPIDVCTEGRVPARQQPQELLRPSVTLQSAVDSLKVTSKESASTTPSNAAAASPQRLRRLTREMGRLLREPHEAYDVYPGAGIDALTCWRVVMDGPGDSPYHGGCWLLYLLFPPEYPNKAPEVRFITPIRHCNVNAHGRVCHSILDRNWAADTSMKTVLNCVYGLLLQPDKHDPVDTTLSLEYHAGGAYEVSIQEHVRKHCNLTRSEWSKVLQEPQEQTEYQHGNGAASSDDIPDSEIPEDGEEEEEEEEDDVDEDDEEEEDGEDDYAGDDYGDEEDGESESQD